MHDLVSDADASNRIHESKSVEKPGNHGNNNNDVQDSLDLGIHRNVVIDKPQENANDDERDDD
jgi:hypothetical protein